MRSRFFWMLGTAFRAAPRWDTFGERRKFPIGRALQAVLILAVASFSFGCGGGEPDKVATSPANVSAKPAAKKPKRSMVPSGHLEALSKASLIKSARIAKRKEWIYPKKDGKLEKKPQLRHEVLFDEDGLPVEEINYKEEDGSLMSRWTHSYKELRLIGDRFFWGKNLQSEKAYKYDERGRLVEKLENDLEEKKTDTRRYKYNDVDDLTEELEVEKDSRSINVYDTEGREIEHNLATGKDAPRPISRKLYDAAGNLVEIQYPLADGFSCWKFKYDERGNQIEFRDQDSDGSVEYRQNKFDAQNRMVEEIRFKEGDPERTRATFTFDPAGRETGRSFFRNDKLENRFESKYDDSGRLIEQTVFSGDGKLKTKTATKYGSHGLIEEERTTDASGQVSDLTRFTIEPRKP